jgi:hypothetical protein
VIEPGTRAEYRAAYARPHRPFVRCEVWNDVEQIDELTQLLGGSVSCSLTSQVTRRGTIVVPAQLMPTVETDLLAPFGNRLRIFRGIRYGEVAFEFPVFTGLIVSATRKPREPTTITFADRAYEVDENDFEAAEETRPGETVVSEIRRLITEGVAHPEFGDSDPVNARAGAQVFDDSRAQACDQLADAAGAFWYALADGRFVVRRVPWAYQADGAAVDPVVTYHERPEFYGSDSGTIIDYGRSMSRENVYNIVVGSADQPDGAEPRRSVVRDTDAGSATYVGSKFGRRVLKAEFPSAAGREVVQFGAETLLRRSRASAEALPWDMVPDPSLELGDPVELRLGDRRLLRIVSEFTMPLTESGEQSCSGRPLVLPNGTVVTELTGF